MVYTCEKGHASKGIGACKGHACNRCLVWSAAVVVFGVSRSPTCNEPAATCLEEDTEDRKQDERKQGGPSTQNYRFVINYAFQSKAVLLMNIFCMQEVPDLSSQQHFLLARPRREFLSAFEMFTIHNVLFGETKWHGPLH